MDNDTKYARICVFKSKDCRDYCENSVEKKTIENIITVQTATKFLEYLIFFVQVLWKINDVCSRLCNFLANFLLTRKKYSVKTTCYYLLDRISILSFENL